MIIFYYLHLASFSPIVNNPIRTRELFLGHNPTVVNHMAYVLQILCVKIRGYKTEGQRDKWDIKPAMFQCCSLNTLRTWQALCLTVRKLFQYPEACGFNSTDWQKKKKKTTRGNQAGLSHPTMIEPCIRLLKTWPFTPQKYDLCV